MTENEKTSVETVEQFKDLQEVSEAKKAEEFKMLEELSKDLKNITNFPARITLKEFETYFLPFIINEVDKDETNSFIFVYNFLEKTEKSWFREVEVVDKHGNVLFILPPLAIDVKFKNNKKDLVVNRIVTKYYNMLNNHYHGTEKELKKGLISILKELTVDEDKFKKYIVEYNKIFERYSERFINAYKRKKGIPVDNEQKAVKENKKVKKLNVNKIDEEDDVFDY